MIQAEGERTPLPLMTQLFRFVATGVLGAIVDYGSTSICQFLLEWQYPVSKTVGFILGTTTAYLINRRWTFQAEPSTKRFVAVALLYVLTFVVQVGIASGLVHWWGDEPLPSAIAFVIAQGIATCINFAVQRLVIFRIEHPHHAPQA